MNLKGVVSVTTELSPSKKRMRDDEKSGYEGLTASEKFAAKENERVENIQAGFFKAVNASYKKALVEIDEAEKMVLDALNKWKAAEMSKK